MQRRSDLPPTELPNPRSARLDQLPPEEVVELLLREEAEAVARHYEDVLGKVRKSQYLTHLSIKPTQLGMDIGADLCFELYDGLAETASSAGSMLWIDMEASPYVDPTLHLFRKLRERHDNVGVCLQAYLYRAADDLEALIPLGPAIRLVKGAYDEPAHVAFPRKQDTDANLLKLAKRLLSDDALKAGVRLGLGTHDIHLIARLNDYVEGARLPKDAYEVQMLYGIRTQDQLRLAAGGYAMRVLISYGSAWFRWYMRRLAERPANLLFVARSVMG